jgi:hypothetical protein
MVKVKSYERFTTDADLIDYFWTLVDKNGPLPERSTGGKIPLLALDGIH